jgi:hypothetical protein
MERPLVQIELQWVARKLMGENLKGVRAELQLYVGLSLL